MLVIFELGLLQIIRHYLHKCSCHKKFIELNKAINWYTLVTLIETLVLTNLCPMHVAN